MPDWVAACSGHQEESTACAQPSLKKCSPAQQGAWPLLLPYSGSQAYQQQPWICMKHAKLSLICAYYRSDYDHDGMGTYSSLAGCTGSCAGTKAAHGIATGLLLALVGSARSFTGLGGFAAAYDSSAVSLSIWRRPPITPCGVSARKQGQHTAKNNIQQALGSL